MKKFATSAILLTLLVFCFACTHNVASAPLKQNVVIIEYTTFNGHPVEMVLHPNDNMMELRIRFNENDDTIFNDDGLDFLKKEVTRLTSGQTIQLEKSGYTFQFLGGHPKWAPYGGMYIQYYYSEYYYKCLHFAMQATVADKTIVARRRDFDGYAEWQPRRSDYK